MVLKSSNVKKILYISLIIIGISGISLGMGFYIYYNPTFSEEREPNRFFWLNYSDHAQDVLLEHPEKIDMISPNWYVLESNGQLNYSQKWTRSPLTDHETVMTICSDNNISIHPMITGGSQENIQSLLANSANQVKFFENLTALLSQYDFDGFCVDFEGIYEDQREEFTTFFAAMKETISSQKNLSIAVPAKTRNTLTGWDGWCDYKTIGEIADMFLIMTYDEHGFWTDPGEVASISWVKKVLAYATREVPLEKIYAGIPRYGYDWIPENPTWPNWGYGFSFFEEKYATYGGTKTRSDDGYEIILEFIDGNGHENICYYADRETTLAKEEFLSGYPIGGYCYWYLTSGDPMYFNAT